MQVGLSIARAKELLFLLSSAVLARILIQLYYDGDYYTDYFLKIKKMIYLYRE